MDIANTLPDLSDLLWEEVEIGELRFEILISVLSLTLLINVSGMLGGWGCQFN